jgi:hypothetical protein
LKLLGLAIYDLKILCWIETKVSDLRLDGKNWRNYEACMASHGRILNSNDSDMDEGRSGPSGFLGPGTEQFALGSLYYLTKLRL